jgi:lipopolysaccharide transport system permease protein
MNPHQGYPISPREMFASFWRNRELIWQMTKREVIGRYRGSIVGLAWSFFNPVLLLCVYTFVFSVVFKARWGTGADESKINFAIILFAGLIVHGIFAECINRAPGLVLGNINYVKKVVFPLEVLPWIAMGSALFHAAVSLSVLLVAQLATAHSLPWTVILFPLLLVPLTLGIMGIAWILTTLGVFIRDIQQSTPLITMLLLFLSPVFYSPAALPEKYRMLLYLNPLTFIIEETRKVLLWGQMLNWTGWVISTAISLGIAWAGFALFQKLRKGFADVV